MELGVEVYLLTEIEISTKFARLFHVRHDLIFLLCSTSDIYHFQQCDAVAIP
jgi:hypothetical protein